MVDNKWRQQRKPNGHAAMSIFWRIIGPALSLAPIIGPALGLAPIIGPALGLAPIIGPALGLAPIDWNRTWNWRFRRRDYKIRGKYDTKRHIRESI